MYVCVLRDVFSQSSQSLIFHTFSLPCAGIPLEPDLPGGTRHRQVVTPMAKLPSSHTHTFPQGGQCRRWQWTTYLSLCDIKSSHLIWTAIMS